MRHRQSLLWTTYNLHMKIYESTCNMCITIDNNEDNRMTIKMIIILKFSFSWYIQAQNPRKKLICDRITLTMGRERRVPLDDAEKIYAFGKESAATYRRQRGFRFSVPTAESVSLSIRARKLINFDCIGCIRVPMYTYWTLVPKFGNLCYGFESLQYKSGTNMDRRFNWWN